MPLYLYLLQDLYVFRCFLICSDWTKFYNELSFLKDMFTKNGYPVSFIDKCFKTFLSVIYKKTSKKQLTLVVPVLKEMSL